MPLFDFQCEDCGKTIELMMKYEESEQPLKCIACEGEMKKQIPTGTGFKFAGECNASDGYTYEYTKCKAGSDNNTDPRIIKRGADKAVEKYANTVQAAKKDGLKIKK